MRILRRKKLKKHINTIAYASLFMVAAIIISIAAGSNKDTIEYVNAPDIETYVVDVVSKTRENLAVTGMMGLAIEETTTTEVAGVTTPIIEETTVAEEITVPETTKNNSSYKGIFMMNTSGNLNIRSKADTSSEVVGVLSEGNGGEVVKYGNEWSKVKSGKVTGYVATEYILIGDKAKKIQQENGYTATITADTLMVRAERSTDSSVLGMVAKGDKYKCIKVYPNWIKIKFQGKTGYISREFAKLDIVMTYAKSVEEIEAEQATEAPTVEQSETVVSQVTQKPTQSTTSQSTASQSSPSQSTVSQSSSQPAQNTQSQESKPSSNVSYDDKYLLACIVACEAGNESYESKLAVANVVLNRVALPVYPNSIKAVIYQRGQFGPAYNSSLDRMLKNGPDSGSQKAANAALAGTNNVPGYLYFGPASSINTKNLKSYRKIDSQIFY